MGATINDIAKKAQVSLTTVSRVLNNSGYVKKETRNRVLNAIEELNYTPSAIARNLSKKVSNTIGVIVPDITNSYFGEIIKGISEEAEKLDLNIVLFNTDDNLDKELKALKVAKEQRLKGIIMTPIFGEEEFNTQYFNTIEGLNMPIVLVATDIKYSTLNGVFVDNIKAGFEVTNLLIKEGHENIAIITGMMSSERSTHELIGYKKALHVNNIPIREELIFNGDFKLDLAYNITKKILNMKDKPTAVVVCSNMMTIGCVKAVLEEGKRIPEDLAVIGFNKLEILDIVGINITYVEDSPEDLGKTAMLMLEEKINSKKENEIKRIRVSPTIVSKGSEKRKK